MNENFKRMWGFCNMKIDGCLNIKGGQPTISDALINGQHIVSTLHYMYMHLED